VRRVDKVKSLLGDQDSLDPVQNAADKFRKLNERFNNRATFHGHSLVEQYHQGRFTIVCDLDIRVADTLVSRGSISSNSPSPDNNLLASVIFSNNIIDRRDLHEWNQKPVFVENVESVQGPKGTIPSLVRFYDIHDEVTDLFGGLVYFCPSNGSYKVMSSCLKRETGMVVVDIEVVKYDLIDSEIKGTVEVVEGIANYEREVIWHGLSSVDLHAIVSELSVTLDAESVRVHSKSTDHFVKVIDVLLGPINLAS
jgi:hypothetical protein